MPYDLFISYSRRDNAQGRITQLVERIKADFAPFAKRELVPFFDQQEITGMQDWRQRILQGLHESRLLLACLSPAYLQSEYCEWEFVDGGGRWQVRCAGKDDLRPDLKSILVYPSTYFSRVTEDDEEQQAAFAGQSWQRDPVILAWDSVQGGVSDRSDGQNVVFHEFAHQLDEEDGQVDGAPVLAAKEPALDRLSRYRSWARILSKEFEQLRGHRGQVLQPSISEVHAAPCPAPPASSSLAVCIR